GARSRYRDAHVDLAASPLSSKSQSKNSDLARRARRMVWKSASADISNDPLCCDHWASFFFKLKRTSVRCAFDDICFSSTLGSAEIAMRLTTDFFLETRSAPRGFHPSFCSVPLQARWNVLATISASCKPMLSFESANRRSLKSAFMSTAN